MSDIEQLQQLLSDIKESLHREINGFRQEMRDGFVQVNAKFDAQEARLECLWPTGDRWSSRMDAWAEKVDGALEAKDREIAELRERILRLERKSA